MLMFDYFNSGGLVELVLCLVVPLVFFTSVSVYVKFFIKD